MKKLAFGLAVLAALAAIQPAWSCDTLNCNEADGSSSGGGK
jgi:hypothetical protein